MVRAYSGLKTPHTFLDLNFWIRLSEGQDAVYRDLSNALHEAVRKRLLICPVSPSLLMELQKRPSSNKREGISQIMDVLSKRLSLRINMAIFTEEFRALLAEEQIERSIAYSHVFDGLSIVFPEDGWGAPSAQKATELILNDIESLSISQILGLGEKGRSQHLNYLRVGLKKLAQQEEKWRQANEEVPPAKIEQAEFAGTVRSFVPYLFHVFEKADFSVKLKLHSMTDNERRELLNSCPTFWNEYKLLAALRSNRRRVEENDLWDLQLAYLIQLSISSP